MTRPKLEIPTLDDLTIKRDSYRASLIDQGIADYCMTLPEQVEAFAAHLQSMMSDQISRARLREVAQLFIAPTREHLEGVIELTRRYNEWVPDTQH